MTDVTGWDIAEQFGHYAATAAPASPVTGGKPDISRYSEMAARVTLSGLKWLAAGLPPLLRAGFWTSFVLVMIPHLPPTDLYPAPPVEALGRISFSHKMAPVHHALASAPSLPAPAKIDATPQAVPAPEIVAQAAPLIAAPAEKRPGRTRHARAHGRGHKARHARRLWLS